MKYILILLVIFSFNSTANVDSLANAVNEIPAAVKGIWEAGEWKNSSGQSIGIFRFVVASGGYEHASSRLFIQWISYETDSSNPKIEESVEVKEVADFYSFHLPKPLKNGASFVIDASHSYSNENVQFEIWVNGKGLYKLSSNKSLKQDK
ncbi:MAG: hypothetical protein QF552_06555 [Litorilituus sp.]|jgi:hypothetical protein|nr:hypothetical protein [Litorilituus sp.]